MKEQSQRIVEIISALVSEDDFTLKSELGELGLAKSRQIKDAVESALMENPTYVPIWYEFGRDPAKTMPILEAILEVLLKTNAELTQRLETFLAEYDDAIKSGTESVRLSTGGGAYIGGSVTVHGGEFVGRDKIIGDGNVIDDSSRAFVVGQPSADVQIERSRLLQVLMTRFDMYELYTISFDLGVDYDSLPGEGKNAKARELISHLERHNRLYELIRVGRELRPDIRWSEIATLKEGT